MSVLFADLVAFTSYSEGRDPETVRETLTRYFEATREVIERHGGQVEKFIGDAVMAEWGAPRTNEDDAERAVRAALEVTEAVCNLGEGLQARVAVLTGQAAVTLGATDQGMVAGDLVNTAARLQGVAPPSTVLVGEATMQAASSAIAFEEAGEQTLKGKTAPVRAWRALRVVADAGGRGRNEGLEPPFVGRELELRLLKDLINTAADERRPRLVSITGPAGIGKSRLAWEFEKYVDGLVETTYWHRGRSPSYGDGIAFWALGEMVRRRARLVESDDEATTRERVHVVVGEFIDAPDRDWVEGALLTLLGLAPPPPGGRDALFAAWRTFFERIAAASPTVLIFEDLHWADDGTIDFIDHLLEWSRDVPLLVITLARPELLERRPGWGTGARSFNAIGLEPLTDSNMRELLDGLVVDLPESAIEQILGRADGIPLYAVEIVRSLISDGRLVPAVDGTYRVAGDLGELTVPDTLRALVASRLDGLDADDRALIQDATVLGQTFDHRALAAITERDTGAVEERLRALVKRELLEVSVDPRSPERGQYGFVQSVIREVAYETLSRRDRRARHLAAARYYEAEGDEELAAVLATHYLAALQASDDGAEADAVAVQARLALRGAADRAIALGAPEQAVIHIRAALEITEDPAERAGLYARAADAAQMAAQMNEAIAYGRDAIRAFDAAGDRQASLMAMAQLNTLLVDYGSLDEAVELLAPVIDEADPYPEAQAGLLAGLARAYMRLGRNLEALEAAERSLIIAEPLRLDRTVAEAMANKAPAMMQLRRPRESLAILRAAADLATEVGDTDLALRVLTNLGVFLSGRDLQEAMRTWKEALETAKRLGQRKSQFWLWTIMTSAAVEEGRDWDGALRQIDAVLADLHEPSLRMAVMANRLWYLIFRGEDTTAAWAELDAIHEEHPNTDEFLSSTHLRGFEMLLQQGAAEEAVVSIRAAIPQLGYNKSEGYGRLLLAGICARDPAVMDEVDAFAESESWITDAVDGMLRLSAAARAAIEERPDEAVRAARESVAILEETGWLVPAAETRLYMVRLLPDQPEFAGWVAEARDCFERIGAQPYLRWLDELDATRQPEIVSAAS